MANTLEIKILQLKQRLTNRQLAKEAGVSEQFLGQVINGHRRSKRVERYLARRLGARVEELFPNGNDGLGEAAA